MRFAAGADFLMVFGKALMLESMVSDRYRQGKRSDQHLITLLKSATGAVWVGCIIIDQHGGGVDGVLQYLFR